MAIRRLKLCVATIILFAPFTAVAQGTGKPARIAIMRDGAPPPKYLAELRRGLEELGHIKGKSYVLIPAWVKGRKKHPKIANGLIGRVDLILTEGTPVTKAAAKAVAEARPPVPVVFVSSGAPVRTGLVRSMSQPGGNVTGIYSGSVELLPKRMEILKQLVPGLKRMGKTSRRASVMGRLFHEAADSAAPVLGVELFISM